MEIIELIPSDISFNDLYQLQARDKKYVYDISFSSNDGTNIGANAFTSSGLWETAQRNSTGRYPTLALLDKPAGTTYPTYDISANPLHENGEFIEIEFNGLNNKPREYFLTQVEISFFENDGEMRVGHIMGGRVQDLDTKYTMLKMMGDYSVIVDTVHTISDITKATAFANPSNAIQQISSGFTKPYYYHYSSGGSNIYIKHITSLQNDITTDTTTDTVTPINGFAYDIYLSSGVYGKDYEFYTSFNDAKYNRNPLLYNEAMSKWRAISNGNWTRKLMMLYEHMGDSIQYGAVTTHTYNLNPIEPYSKFRFVFEQLKTGSSLKIKQIKLKGTRQAYKINAYDAHLEHFSNYDSFNQLKNSVSFDENKNTIINFKDLEQSHQYSMFLIPSVLVFMTSILILKNKI